jgi:ketosteroid isomerase-like protein
MKRILVLAVVGSLLASAAQSQTGNSPEQEILQAFHTLDNASIKKDRATMERMMADDFAYTHSNGAVNNKAQEIQESTSADSKWTASKMDNLRVRIYGDVAVITGVQTLTGSAKGYVSGPRRLTDLWVKRNGRWQSIGGQSTIIPPK